MAVAYIGTGTWTEVLNTAITPGLPTRAADDVLVAVIALRSRTATVSVTSGSGWTERINYPSSWSSGTDRIYVFTRTATNTTADNVTFTPSGGDATVDVVGFIFSARGADLSNPFQTTYSTYSDTATNEDIPTTALTVAKAGSMAVVVGIKANDSGATTEILTPSGWTVIMLDDSTLGSDILLGSYYKITSADNESANPGTLDVQPSSSAASVSSVIFALQEPATGTSYDNSLTVSAGSAVSENGIGTMKGTHTLSKSAATAQGSNASLQANSTFAGSAAASPQSVASMLLALQLAGASTAAPGSSAAMRGTATLNDSAAISQASNAAMNVASSMSAASSAAQGSSAALRGSASLPTGASVGQASTHSAHITTLLGASSGLTASGKLSAVASLQLIDAAALALNGGLGLFGTVPLSQLAAMVESGVLSVPLSLTLAHQTAISDASRLDALTHLSLSHIASALQAGSLSVSQTLSVGVVAGATGLSRLDGIASLNLISASSVLGLTQLHAVGFHTLGVVALVAAQSSAAFGLSSSIAAQLAASLSVQLKAAVQVGLSGAAGAALGGQLQAVGSVSVLGGAAIAGTATVQFINTLALAGIVAVHQSYGGAQVLDLTMSLSALSSLVQAGIVQLNASTVASASAAASSSGKLIIPGALNLAAAGLVLPNGNLSINAVTVIAQIALSEATGATSAQVTLSLPMASVLTPGAMGTWGALLTLSGASTMAQSSSLDAAGLVSLPTSATLSLQSLQAGNVGLQLSVAASAGESLSGGLDNATVIGAVASLTASGTVEFYAAQHLQANSAYGAASRLGAASSVVLAQLAAQGVTSQLQGIAGLELGAIALQVQAAVVEMFGAVSASIRAGASVSGAVLEFVVTTPAGRQFIVTVDLRTGEVETESRRFEVGKDGRHFAALST